jgi:hypothetical protein
VDAEVSRRKFAKEMSAMRNEAASLVARLGWEVVTAEYPVFAVTFTHPRTKRRVGFRFQFDNWDEQPPSLSLFDPDNGAELPWEKWPQGTWAVGNPHPVTGKPFLCLPGIREYHIHTSHLTDLWDNLKGNDSYRLLHLVHRVQQRFGDTNG